MKLNIFDVIELIDNKKVIVIDEIKDGYKVKDVNDNKIYEINNFHISKVIYKNLGL